MNKSIIKLETLKYARITALIFGGISISSIWLLLIAYIHRINNPALEINYVLWGLIFFIVWFGLIAFFRMTRKEIKSIDQNRFIIFSQLGLLKTSKTIYLKEEIDSIQIVQNSRKYYEAQLLLKNGSVVLLDIFSNEKQAEYLITAINQNIL